MKQPTRPCQGCPWSPSTPGYLHPDRAEEIADCARNGRDFYCHKSVTWHDSDDDVDATYVANGDEQLCAGYITAALRDGMPGQLLRIQLRLRMLNPDDFEDPEHDHAFDPDEMGWHHEHAWSHTARRETMEGR